MKLNFNKIFLSLAFAALIIGAGIYYYTHHNKSGNNSNSSANTKEGGIPITQVQNNTSEKIVISNYNEYMVKVLDIRGPINKSIEDILSKTKYKTLFNADEMVKQAEDVKGKINDGIKTLKDLNLSSELATINAKQVKSLELLNEAMDAYVAFQNATDQTEQQKQSELMSYKIDESNKQIQDVSTSSSSGGSGSSGSSQPANLNVTDVLQ